MPKKPKELKGSYLLLNSEKVLKTVQELAVRIRERFPESSLFLVCAELETVCSRSRERIDWIAQPIWPLRILRYMLVAIALIGVGFTIYALQVDQSAGELELTDWIQTLEAALNEVVMLGFGILFVWGLEGRLKRRRAMRALHELRSIAHVIDMHQLTKDPDRLDKNRPNTESSPALLMTAFNLRRYLDYCSEMLSLVGKVAALHLQTLDDATVVATVNEIEDLTTGLSRKIWQKIDMLRGEE
ncbi:hypothetical protein OAL92_02270 [bacterium]|nr:hypothetical protein [bacterium]